MTDHAPDSVEVLRTIWAQQGQDRETVEQDCGPQTTCKNMKHVSFDGMAEPGTDLREAWRERLAREGKLGAPGQSIRDMVLGPETAR